MKTSTPFKLKLWPLAAIACAAAAHAQTIEKMKLSDGSLTCAQLYAESQQMDQVMRTGAMPMAAAYPGAAPGALPYGMNSQAIAGQAQAAGQRLSQDPQVMAMAQQYAAKAQAGTLTPQEQQQYAMLMLQNPAVQQEMQKMTGVVLGEVQNSGAIQQAMNQALAAQGQAAATSGLPYAGGAANTQQAMANAQALGLFGGTAQNNTQGIMSANGLSRQDLYTTQQLMLQSRDPKVRAAASDPQSVAQYAAVLRNPQLAMAASRAAAAGVNPAIIQSQINAASLYNPSVAPLASGGKTTAEQRMAATAAANQANTMAIANQGQRYQQLVAQGVPWQQALAQAQAETQGKPATALPYPAAAPAQDAGQAVASNLLGALAAKSGNPQAANLLGSLFGGAKNQAAAAPQPVAVAAAPVGGNLAVQAQARKEHLTSMFLSKGCKLSDVNR